MRRSRVLTPGKRRTVIRRYQRHSPLSRMLAESGCCGWTKAPGSLGIRRDRRARVDARGRRRSRPGRRPPRPRRLRRRRGARRGSRPPSARAYTLSCDQAVYCTVRVTWATAAMAAIRIRPAARRISTRLNPCSRRMAFSPRALVVDRLEVLPLRVRGNPGRLAVAILPHDRQEPADHCGIVLDLDVVSADALELDTPVHDDRAANEAGRLHTEVAGHEEDAGEEGVRAAGDREVTVDDEGARAAERKGVVVAEVALDHDERVVRDLGGEVFARPRRC